MPCHITGLTRGEVMGRRKVGKLETNAVKVLLAESPFILGRQRGLGFIPERTGK